MVSLYKPRHSIDNHKGLDPIVWLHSKTGNWRSQGNGLTNMRWLTGPHSEGK